MTEQDAPKRPEAAYSNGQLPSESFRNSPELATLVHNYAGRVIRRDFIDIVDSPDEEAIQYINEKFASQFDRAIDYIESLDPKKPLQEFWFNKILIRQLGPYPLALIAIIIRNESRETFFDKYSREPYDKAMLLYAASVSQRHLEEAAFDTQAYRPDGKRFQDRRAKSIKLFKFEQDLLDDIEKLQKEHESATSEVAAASGAIVPEQ